ncbi:MAG: hypothetical protein ACFFD4_37105 [Candidatus Odinarchaeota archaeon]
MTVSKYHRIMKGLFFTKDPKIIYRCEVRDTKGLIISLLFNCILSTLFIFWLLFDVFSSLNLEVVPFIIVFVIWLIIIAWQLPKKYRYIQFNNYTLVLGTGSFTAIFKSWFQTKFVLKKMRYDSIEYIRLDRWVNPKKKPQSFGRIEIKIDSTSGFQIFVPVNDMRELIRIFDKHRFQKKPRKIQKQDEWFFIFPNSPAYDMKEMPETGEETEIKLTEPSS